MIGRNAAAVVMTGLAVLHLAAVVAPALVLTLAARKGGIPGWHGVDLLAASAAVGTGHAVVVWRRLRAALRRGTDAVSVSIAAFNALVVLALASTLLLIVVAGGFAAHHATLINRGWPVLLLWIGIQGAAVTLAEALGARLLRWLRAEERHTSAHSSASGADPSDVASHPGL